jgi:predicted site-specific integrase-resolvase
VVLTGNRYVKRAGRSPKELVADLLAIVTLFSGRFGGLRSYKDVLREAALYKEEDR